MIRFLSVSAACLLITARKLLRTCYPCSQLLTMVPCAAANGVGQKSKRSAAIEGGLAPGTAAEADAEAPSEAQPVDTADYWTPVQQEPEGVTTPFERPSHNSTDRTPISCTASATAFPRAPVLACSFALALARGPDYCLPVRASLSCCSCLTCALINIKAILRYVHPHLSSASCGTAL